MAAWRYFVSHALRLSLLLINEDRPNTAAGLLLPLEGVACYFYWKLKEVLPRFAPASAVAEFRTQFLGFLEEELNLGKREGGNVVMSWDPVIRGFIRVSPPK